VKTTADFGITLKGSTGVGFGWKMAQARRGKTQSKAKRLM
jgi:hypothetical protein